MKNKTQVKNSVPDWYKVQVSWRSEQTRSTSSQPRLPVLTTHTVLPGPVNVWSLFPRTYFFLPGAFLRKSVFRRNQGASLRLQSIATGIEGLDCSNAACTNFVRLVQSNCTTYKLIDISVQFLHHELVDLGPFDVRQERGSCTRP